MKKLLCIILAVVMPLMALADTYPALWKKVTEAQAKDLPKSQMEWLDKIIYKAQKGADYGQLLKAQLLRAAAQTQIAPDSADVELSRLESKMLEAKSPVVRAVYATVLGKLYDQRQGSDDAKEKSKHWFAVAMEQPALLAQNKCTEYEPAIVEGVDSKIFNDDLLHVVGMEAKAYTTLLDYYKSKGNRPAACICACLGLRHGRAVDTNEVRKSKYLQALDSLIRDYGDLREAGELAIERSQFLSNAPDVTAEDNVNYINYALNKWGDWPRMNQLRNDLSNLQQPRFNINVGDRMLLPQTDRLVRINFIRNIGTLTLNIYRLNVEGDSRLNPDEPDDWTELQKKMVPGALQTLVKRYIGQPAWKENSDSMVIKGLPIGVYLVEATTDNGKIQTQRVLLNVSDLYLMAQALPDKQLRYVVVSATTGEAVSGAHLRITLPASYDNEKEQTIGLCTDKNGEAYYKYSKRAPNKVFVYTDTDRAFRETNIYTNYSYWSNNGNGEDTRLFTDRSIYRSGQQVHVALVAFKQNRTTLTTTPQVDKQVKLTLYDANGKEVSSQDVTTDKFGSASADFMLPKTGLTGNFFIKSVDNAIVRFLVEEYKRPTFEVTFDACKESYQPGDTMKVRGWAKTYSGVPVQGARVSYEVNRKPSLWWSWRVDGNIEQLLADSTVTADDGSFVVKLPMTYPDNINLDHAAYFNIVANAKVTDSAGETHETTTSLALSNRQAVLTVDLPEKSLRDSLRRFTVKRINMAGEPVDGTVSYRWDGQGWKKAQANKPIALDGMLASGKHELEVICSQDTVKTSVIVFSYNDKKPVVTTHDWFYVSANQFPHDGSPVYVQVGTSDKNTHVYYSIFSADKLLGRGVGKLSDEVVTRKLHYKEEYGNGITLSLAWVKHGKMYTHQVSITRPVPDNKLSLSWKTFRDKLTPGQKEQWILHIETPQGRPATAQLLASMYDKSLDAIFQHHWDFDIRYSFSTPRTSWTQGAQPTVGFYGFESFNALNVHSLDFSHFDPEMFDFANPYRFRYNGPMMLMARADRSQAVADAATFSLEAAPAKRANVMAKTVGEASLLQGRIRGLGKAKNQETGNGTLTTAMQVRENLTETAFFYPALTTDVKGNVDISFTLPESVTTWKFMGLAHDVNFCYGFINAEAVAKKAVMVQPHLPRFVRQGDRAVVTCRIANTSDKDVKGRVRLQLLTPEDNKEVEDWTSPFSVKAGQTITTTFTIDGDRLANLGHGASLFFARATAEGQGFSDGEQQYLPLLPNAEYVTTTRPFTQNGPGVKTLNLSKLFPSSDKRNRLTVEYTNNPAWLMIQALPSVANPTEHNAISLSAALYANSIAQHLLTSAPAIAQTVKLWQTEQGYETSLTSNLQKNSELKTMVLSETPWVADANRETEQKQRLANYLDASAADYRMKTFAEKLSALQNPDGSFSWWPDMPGNKWMTMEVVGILTRLNSLTATQGNAALLSQAFTYLDKRIADEVKELKKETPKRQPQVLSPSEFACDYLYASALAGRMQTSDVRYLLGLLEKQTAKLTIYGKARAAVILAQYGHVARAKEYLQSLNEYTVYKEETGRYYDTRRALYTWKDYRIPTQVAAIEAMQLLSPDDTKTLEEMRRWLVQEKHTQSWDTPTNTVDAVYAFLADPKGHPDMSKLSATQTATLKVDGRPLDLPQATSGLGYVKTVVDTPALSTFTAEKTTDGTSWGALYAQYWQQASDVPTQSSGLKVKREVLVNGKVIDDKTDKIKVGEKIKVRITITADRDYDFVQVQDKRAACLEPVGQTSGYRWGYYCSPKDNVTDYYFDLMAKGQHVVETDYYVDRQGEYISGICTAQCAYSPEFSGREGTKHFTIIR